jgi:predicted RNase H-like nuclease
VRVLGVDACPGGWVGVLLDDRHTTAWFGAGIAGLVHAAESAGGTARVVAVDIPIGLPDAGRRTADLMARRAAGPRRSSVFLTPVRRALTAGDHAAAVRVNRELAGAGVSVQAFGLRSRILEVEGWLRTSGRAVVEVHPEVCFAALAGAPMSTRKATWAGAEERRALLRRRPRGHAGARGRESGRRRRPGRRGGRVDRAQVRRGHGVLPAGRTGGLQRRNRQRHLGVGHRPTP